MAADRANPYSMESLASFQMEQGYNVVGEDDKHVLHILLGQKATKETELKAYVHALYLQHRVKDSSLLDPTIYLEGCEWMKKHFTHFHEALRAHGWHTNRVLVGTGDRRVQWSMDADGDKKSL